MPPKTSCPVTAAQFAEKAEPLKISINGQEMLAEVKQFSTGSFGWYLNGKTVVTKLGKAGSREEFEVVPPFAVVIGNARSVKLERNGQPVDCGLTGKMTIARLKFE